MPTIKYKENEIPYTIVRSKIKNLYIHIKEGNVIVKAPLRLSESKIRKFVIQKSEWIAKNVNEYKKKPKIEEKITQEELNKLAQLIQKNIQKYISILGVSPKQVRIRNLKYAWGSCSTNKNISINSKLAKKSEKTIEYVVLHEMCHLVYMNHSKQFWALVGQNMPDYKKWKKELKE